MAYFDADEMTRRRTSLENCQGGLGGGRREGNAHGERATHDDDTNNEGMIA